MVTGQTDELLSLVRERSALLAKLDELLDVETRAVNPSPRRVRDTLIRISDNAASLVREVQELDALLTTAAPIPAVWQELRAMV